MIKNKQLFKHDPDNNIFGDCHRTAIACLLNKQPEEVPHITAKEWADSYLFNKHFDEYLETQGLFRIDSVYDCSLEDVLDHMEILNPSAYFLLGGSSANRVNHTVICRGGEIVWDPSIDNSGIVGPCDDGYFWITHLAPLMMKEKA